MRIMLLTLEGVFDFKEFKTHLFSVYSVKENFECTGCEGGIVNFV